MFISMYVYHVDEGFRVATDRCQTKDDNGQAVELLGTQEDLVIVMQRPRELLKERLELPLHDLGQVLYNSKDVVDEVR